MGLSVCTVLQINTKVQQVIFKKKNYQTLKPEKCVHFWYKHNCSKAGIFFSQKLSKVIKYQNPSNMSLSNICTIDLQKTPTTMRSNPCNRGTLYVILYGQNDLGQQLVFFSPKNQNPSKM